MPKVSEFPYQAPTAETQVPVIGETHFLVGDIVKAKVYRALLYQIGTAAPVATVLENTLNGSVVWSYNAVGSYFGTLAGAFTVNKCFTVAVFRNPNQVGFIAAKAPNTDNDDILLETFNGTARQDNMITDGCCVEVLVYP